MKTSPSLTQGSIAMIAAFHRMLKKTKIVSRCGTGLLAASASLLLVQPVQAAGNTSTWIGASGADWNSGTSWSGTDKPPVTADTALFNSGAGTSISVANAIANQSLTSISFDTSAGSYTIGTTGGDLIGVASGGTIQILSSLSATNAIETINAPIILAGNYTFANGSANGTGVGAGTLNFGGAITTSATSGTTTLAINGANTNANTISGAISNGTGTNSVAVTKSGAGTWVLSGPNTYSGTTTVSAGTLDINNGSVGTTTSSAIGTGTLTISGGTIDSTVSGIVLGTNNTINDTADFAFGGSNNLNLGTGSVSLNVPANTSGTRTITLNGGNTLTLGAVSAGLTGNASNTLTINQGTGSGGTLVFGSYVLTTSVTTGIGSNIAGSGNLVITGTVSAGGGAANDSLTYSGTGTLTLDGSNSWAGTMSVKQGTAIAGSNVPALAGTNGAFGNSGVAINLGSTTSGQTGPAAILAASGVTVARGITELASTLNSALIIGGSNTGGVATYSGPIILKGNSTPTTLTSASGGVVDFTGAISDFAGTSNSLIINGGGTVDLSGLNTYTGTTTVSAGTLVAGAPIANSTILGASVTVTVATHVINLAANPLVNGSQVTFTATTVPTGLAAGTVYYVVNSTASTFQVSATLGGSPISISTAGSGVAVTNPGVFGTANSAIVLGDSNTGGSTVGLLIGGAYTNGRPITVANVGSGTTIGGSNIGGTTATYTGSITLNKAVTLQAATGGTVDFNTGTWTTNDNPFTIGSSGNAGTVELDNAVTTAGGVSVNYGALNQNNALTGALAITNAATVSQTAGGSLTGSLNDTSSGSSSFAGLIADNGGTPSTVTLNNASGTLALTGTANTFTGAVAVNSGILSFAAGNSSATAAQSLGENSGLTLGTGSTSGTLDYTGSGATTLAKAVTAQGSGGADTIQNSGGGLLTLTGGLTKNGTKLTLIGGANGINVTTNGITGSNPNSDLLVTGGVTQISVASSYNGPTTIYGNGRLITAVTSALPTTPAYSLVTLGATGETSSTTNTLDLDGTAQTIAGLSSIASGTNQVINSNGTSPYTTAGAATTLTISPGSGISNTFGGSLGGTGSTNNFGVTLNAADNTGAQVLTGTNTYTGGTLISTGKLYVDGGVAGSSTSSGTGTGAVSVTSGGTLAGSGNIVTASGVSFGAGATLASGPVQASAPSVTGPGLTFTNTSVTLSGTGAGALSANLTFDLGSGTDHLGVGTPGPGNFTNPITDTTYMTLSGTSKLNFSGTESLSLVDLTAPTSSTGATLTLRLGTPYLLVAAGSGADYTGLITVSGSGASAVYSINGASGYVVGVLVSGSGYTGGSSAPLNTQYTPIAINQYDSDGMTPLTSGDIYPDPVLYLNGGDLEVVPEPGTWALMAGGLAVLVFWQRRRSSI